MSKTTPNIDFSAYEKERAAHHEARCRVAATMLLTPYFACRIRKCRRDGKCTGPAIPSERQMGHVRAQQALGLSGRACVNLPLCIILGDDRLFAAFQAEIKRISEMREGRPLKGVHFDRAVKARTWTLAAVVPAP
ncbi:hypothetical protein [Rhizobium tubonense]|uniref:Uncharacterized protein n=1 Tax=Rhizobium tubonense TaxID=484088 RepID=A0A2W4EB58_9HYPH|nr:hypothetical protein [Rhizobium tubonense]PZM09443.1 hypothetical protein CPY51_24415 [Rhizobium tubonense]